MLNAGMEPRPRSVDTDPDAAVKAGDNDPGSDEVDGATG
jgi:hypothetical protein